MGGGGGGRSFEAGRLLTFSAFRMDAYSRWALIRINTALSEPVFTWHFNGKILVFFLPSFKGILRLSSQATAYSV